MLLDIVFPSKTKKLFLSPQRYFRDYLLKKDPVDYLQIPNIAPTGVSPINSPIDIVYTWVDGDDETHEKNKSIYLGKDTNLNAEGVNSIRWKSRDELKFSLRSIAKYAPWVNKVYIVTNGQALPKWLNTNHFKLKIIDHSEIIPAEYLPTFNSHVIESAIHRIDGLSEHYIYFNDDVMLGRPTLPSDFFEYEGHLKALLSNAYISNGPAQVDDPESVWAVKNARSIIFASSQYLFFKRFTHYCHPQLKSIAQSAEYKFSESYHKCRLNRFRSKDDILITSFINYCEAYLNGKASLIKIDETMVNGIYIKIKDVSAANKYRIALKYKETEKAKMMICVNDHMSISHTKKTNYEDDLLSFLNAYFSEKSVFEI